MIPAGDPTRHLHARFYLTLNLPCFDLALYAMPYCSLFRLSQSLPFLAQLPYLFQPAFLFIAPYTYFTQFLGMGTNTPSNGLFSANMSQSTQKNSFPQPVNSPIRTKRLYTNQGGLIDTGRFDCKSYSFALFYPIMLVRWLTYTYVLVCFLSGIH